MKLYTQKSNKKTIILTITGLLLLLAVAAFFYIYLNNTKNTEESVNTTGTNQTQEINTDTTPADNVDTKPDNTNTEPTGTPSPEGVLDASITTSSVSGSNLEVRTLINEVVSTGSCAFTATQGRNTVQRSAQIQPLASTSTCKGFTIPTNELTSGDWTFTLTITTEGKNAELSGSFRI